MRCSSRLCSLQQSLWLGDPRMGFGKGPNEAGLLSYRGRRCSGCWTMEGPGGGWRMGCSQGKAGREQRAAGKGGSQVCCFYRGISWSSQRIAIWQIGA
jgi:hypothetical protein